MIKNTIIGILLLTIVFEAAILFSEVKTTLGVAPRVFLVSQGGTGTSTAPNVGDVLVGVSGGIYTPRATSTLGFLASGGTPTFASATLSNFTTGSVIFAANGGALTQDNSNFFWDDTNNRLGLGTTTPNYDLDIVDDGDDNNASLRLKSTSNGSTASLYLDSKRQDISGHSTLYFLDNGTTYATISNIPLKLTVDATSTVFTTHSLFVDDKTSGASRLAIDSDGEVGIGTFTPTSKLHVVQTGTANAFRVDDVANDTSPFVIDANGNVGIRNMTPSSTLHVIGSSTITNTSSDVSFMVEDSASPDGTPFVIDASGRLGIGTSTPRVQIDALIGAHNTGTGFLGAGNANLGFTGPNILNSAGDANFVLTTNTNMDANIGPTIALGGRYITDSAADVGFAKIRAAKENNTSANQNGYLSFLTKNHNQAAYVEGMRITSGQLVGFGTASPTRTVTIQDTMRLVPRATAPSSPVAGDMYVDSTPAANELCFYDGSAWQGISSGTDANCS